MDKTIAYLVSRFPKLTETFVLYEMQALEGLGAQIELFPLIRQRESVIHPEAENWIQRAHYRRWYHPKLTASQLYWFRQAPGQAMDLWAEIFSTYRRKLKFLLRSLYTVWFAFDIARQIATMGIDHIHAHWATNPTTAAYIIHHLTGIPYSFTAHAHDIYVDQTMLSKKIESAAFTVTISEYNRQYLRQVTQQGSIQVLHCGVDTGVFTPPIQRDNQVFTLLSVGALEEKKGHRYLIEALKEIASQGIQLRCLLVGDGQQRNALEAQIEDAGLNDRVVLLGGLPRVEILAALEKADVMVLPSVRLETGKQEGIPVALMEAMAMELPVITSRISGMPELVTDKVNGLLVPEKDPAALAAAILTLYHNPEYRRTLGKNARQKVQADFDLQESARLLYDSIQEAGEARKANVVNPTAMAQMIKPEAK